MNILTWYVGFWPSDPLLTALKRRRWTAWGHVEAWGYTADSTWLFFDPQHDGTIIRVTHHHDEVEALMAEKLMLCESILKTPYFGAAIRTPLHPTMNCAAQVGHLLGVRAYAPRTLHRILRENGAVEIKDVRRRVEGERSGQGREGTGPAPCGDGPG